MFMSRLDDASYDAKHDYKMMSPAKGEKSGVNDVVILEKMSEYLFDLFDANCMEEFKMIEKLEEEALVLFGSSISEEYTFEQEEMHKRFVQLFEKLIEDFLTSENISNQEFYSIVKRYMNNPHSKTSGVAEEILEVIGVYTDFQWWASMMKEQAKYRHDFVSFQEKIDNAVAKTKNEPKSFEHRFENEMK